jgi:tetratricopeptide (TPR) repeat protein
MFKFFKKKVKEKQSSFNELDMLKNENKIIQEGLEKTASRNNSGIVLEKDGKIDEAIKVYEENVNDNVVATHSYDRLMIIYRKRQDYKNEIRIINIAMDVFTKENENRYQKGLKKANNEKLKDQIHIGYKNCENVLGNDGWIIYSPYPVKKYQKRLNKAIELNAKSNINP